MSPYPAQVPDLIALRGDPSDNLRGAPGVGAAGAATSAPNKQELAGLSAYRGRPVFFCRIVARSTDAVDLIVGLALRERQQLGFELRQEGRSFGNSTSPASNFAWLDSVTVPEPRTEVDLAS
jgi:hypothetical protein